MELERQRLLADHVKIVKRIAGRMFIGMPASVQFDDLFQAGMLGLIAAAKRFDPGRGATFATYAFRRIEGAIVDSLRGDDPMPRALRTTVRRTWIATAKLEQALGRAPTHREIAAGSGLSLPDYHETLDDAGRHVPVMLEDIANDEGVPMIEFTAPRLSDPAEALSDAGDRRMLDTATAKLDVRTQSILAMSYGEDMTLEDIGRKLDISLSRVSQLRTAALKQLRLDPAVLR